MGGSLEDTRTLGSPRKALKCLTTTRTFPIDFIHYSMFRFVSQPLTICTS